MGQIAKHSVMIDGHKTSVSLEPEFWQALTEIAAIEERSLNALIGGVDRGRTGNLSSALRLYALAHFRHQAKEPAVTTAATPNPAPPA
ncbi:MAG: ribbon-helix-helix domain-containing protein [Alphaproteobacteria bacterium]|nr:ribbon-helix-helix domain-containing protein [Alphaproteobacteria bacterium]